MKRIFALSFIKKNPDLGLLLFRVAFAFPTICFHGWKKLMGAAEEFHTFPNYIGISSELSYVLVAFFETAGAVLIALGLFTRFNSLGLTITMAVAFIFHHHWKFRGENAGEMAFVCFFAYLLLTLTGPGKYSLDRLWGIDKPEKEV
jgi:putative oxidoreductase